MNIIKKLDWIKEFIHKNNLSAFLFTSVPNIFYLTQFKSSNAFIIITKKDNYFLTDSRYFEKAQRELKNWEIVLIKDDTFYFLKEFLKELKIEVLGFEKDGITCEFREKLKIRNIKFKGFSKVLKELRMIKTNQEIEILKEGIRKTDQIYKSILKLLEDSIFSNKNSVLTELGLRGFLVSKIFEIGGYGESFPAIIATGKNSSIPHWESSKTKIKKNSPLLIDIGIIWKGYCTDFTRTLYIGTPSSEFKKIYEVVKNAWYKGFEKVKEGTYIFEIDKAIREYFYKKGLDKFYIHAGGHGIGIEVHEPPKIFYKKDIRKKQKEIIKDGMVFTIEPGIYFPNKFGIRLENIVIVEKRKGEIYSEIDLELKKID